MSLTSNAYFNSLKVIFGNYLRTSVSQVINQFDDEEAFKRHLRCNNVDIEKDLTEENINAILDKWPAFFDGMKIDMSEKEKREYYIIL